MNRTSAADTAGLGRRAAASAVMTRLGSPGAPGWTIGADWSSVAERHPARAATATARHARRRSGSGGLKRVTSFSLAESPHRRHLLSRVGWHERSGSGKSSLVSQALVELVAKHLGHQIEEQDSLVEDLERLPVISADGGFAGGMEAITRLVCVDQRPIGRTPRSNLATYTGLFDYVRKLFASTARARRYDAGRFSFNVAKGRCENCQGEGFVMVELLFLASVYAPCPTCHGNPLQLKDPRDPLPRREHRRGAQPHGR